MALSELLSRVNFSYGNTSSGTPSLSRILVIWRMVRNKGIQVTTLRLHTRNLTYRPRTRFSFSDAYKQWITSVEAGVTIVDVEKEYEEMERELNGLKKELKVLKERRYVHFDAPMAQAETVQ